MKHFFRRMKKKTITARGILLLMAVFLMAGCDDTVSNKQIDEIIVPDSMISYSKYIQPVLTIKCASSGCHDDQTKAGSLSCTNYLSLTHSSNANLIVPGSPQTSTLVQSIKGLSSNPMPPLPNPYPLTQNQIKGIETWVKEGAKNN